jgi:hypothetical protein
MSRATVGVSRVFRVVGRISVCAAIGAAALAGCGPDYSPGPSYPEGPGYYTDTEPYPYHGPGGGNPFEPPQGPYDPRRGDSPYT